MLNNVETKGNKENQQKDKHNINSIQEQNKKVNILTINREIDNKFINVLLDTGNFKKFISENIIKSLKIIETQVERKLIFLPDGKKIEIQEYCKLQLKLDAIKTHY